LFVLFFFVIIYKLIFFIIPGNEDFCFSGMGLSVVSIKNINGGSNDDVVIGIPFINGEAGGFTVWVNF